MDPQPLEPAPGDRRSSSWDLKNAPKNYFWLIVFQFAASAFALAAVWLNTRYLGREGWGLVFAVLAASQIVQIFTNWTSVAVVKYGVEEYVETAVIARTFWTRTIILAINLAILLVSAGLWFPLLNKAFTFDSELVWLVLVHFAVCALWVHVQMGMQAAKQLRAQGFLLMAERFVVLVGVLGLLALAKLTVLATIVCYISAAGAMTVLGIIQLRSVIFRRFEIDRAFFRKIMIYSLPLLPNLIVGGMAGSYVDAAFVARFLSKDDLGVYSIASQFSGLVLQVPTLANTILLPLFLTQQVEAKHERSFFFFKHVLPVGLLAWGLGCTVMAFAGYLFIPLVFKPAFADARLPLWILLAATLLWIPIALGYAALINSLSATWIILLAGVAAGGINVVADILLIPRYGMAGCAWATLFAYLGSVVVYGLYLKKAINLPFSWGILALLPGLCGAVIMSLYETPWISLMICAALTTVIALIQIDSVRQTISFVTSLRRQNDAAS